MEATFRQLRLYVILRIFGIKKIERLYHTNEKALQCVLFILRMSRARDGLDYGFGWRGHIPYSSNFFDYPYRSPPPNLEDDLYFVFKNTENLRKECVEKKLVFLPDDSIPDSDSDIKTFLSEIGQELLTNPDHAEMLAGVCFAAALFKDDKKVASTVKANLKRWRPEFLEQFNVNSEIAAARKLLAR